MSFVRTVCAWAIAASAAVASLVRFLTHSDSQAQNQ